MTATTPSNEKLGLVRQMVASFQERDVKSAIAVLHPEVQAHPSIGGLPLLEGRDAVAAWWRGPSDDDGALEIRPLEFEQRGDCVIVRGYLRHREGRTLAENQVFWVYGFRDGLIDRMESYPTREAARAACS